MSKSTPTSRKPKVTRTPVPRKVRKTLWIPNTAWLAFGRFLTSRSRDIALIAIVLGAFVAVFDGSLYSATRFSFMSWSAYAFAVMPDALMVICAAKQRQVGITAAQWATAHKWMQFAFRFSLVTNMIAAFLRNAPAEWITPEMLLVGAIAYHGIVVWFLKGAVDVLTTVRAERKTKAAPAPVVPQAIPVHVTPAIWQNTVMANVRALVDPMGRKA